MESSEAAQVSFTRTIEDGTLNEVMDGKEIPIVQAAEIYQARKRTWTLVGMTFVREGIKYCAIEGKGHDEEGSWHRRYVPDR